MSLRVVADHKAGEGYYGIVLFEGREIYRTPQGQATSQYDAMQLAAQRVADRLRVVLKDNEPQLEPFLGS